MVSVNKMGFNTSMLKTVFALRECVVDMADS